MSFKIVPQAEAAIVDVYKRQVLLRQVVEDGGRELGRAHEHDAHG